MSESFEERLEKSLGILSESIDSYLDVIQNRDWAANPDETVTRMMNFLKQSPEELDDWVSALEIAVVEWEILNNFTLDLAAATNKLENLPTHLRPVVAGVLEALSAAEWSDREVPEPPLTPPDPA